MKKPKVVELGENDVMDIVRLTSSIDRTFIGQSGCYEWYFWLVEGTKVWGIKENNRLVAIGSLSFYNQAGDAVDYLKANVSVLTSGQVHPDYRGRGYQVILIRVRIIFSLRNRIYNIQSLVKEANSAAVRNLSKMGFINQGLYDNGTHAVVRFIYHNSLLILMYKIYNFFRKI